MTAVNAPAPPRRATTVPARDRSIDLLRSASLVLVVLLHATMVGVTVSGGEPVFANALETDWFGPVSWLVQMMPLFFIAGGFTAIGSWRRARARGIGAAEFASGRVLRLMRPAIAVFAVIAAGLGLLAFSGVPADVVATAGFRISQPLWFLGVFLLVQALVPAMAAWHERRPLVALGALAGAAAAVDAVRFTTGSEAIGMLNLAFVWLFIQQLGFWDADGRVERLSKRTRLFSSCVVVVVLILMVALGPYVADMYANQDPPTLLLALLGVAQLLLFSLAKPWLRRMADLPLIGAATDAIGSRAMTIYLWHMPVLIGLAGLSVLGALSGALALPELHSAAWWATRPVWLAIAAVSVALVAAGAARTERRACEPSGIGWRAAAGTVLGVGCVALMFAAGLTWPTAVLCAALAATAAGLSGDFPLMKTQAVSMVTRLSPRHAGGVSSSTVPAATTGVVPRAASAKTIEGALA